MSLLLIAEGEISAVAALLDDDPGFVHRAAPHPYWGGHPHPLHVAIEMNRTDVFTLLLDRGADPNVDSSGYDGWTPLMLAIQRGRTALRDELIRLGARVGLVEALLWADDEQMSQCPAPASIPSGGSLLNFARTTAAIDYLLELGAPIDLPDRWGVTPVAALSGVSAALVRHLASRGARVTAAEWARLGEHESIDPASAVDPATLWAAVEAGRRETAAWLLERGAPVNARRPDQSRQTALHIAAWNGDARMVELLLAHGADRVLRDEEHGATAAEWARTAVKIRNAPECATVAERLERE